MLGGGIDVDDVDPGPVAPDDAAVGERLDRAGPDVGVLAKDAVGVVRDGDDLVLALALRRHELEPRALDDRPLDLDVTEVVVEHDHLDALRVAHIGRNRRRWFLGYFAVRAGGRLTRRLDALRRSSDLLPRRLDALRRDADLLRHR